MGGLQGLLRGRVGPAADGGRHGRLVGEGHSRARDHWEEEALKYLPLILENGRPPRYVKYGGIDAFNAAMTEGKRGLSVAEVLRQLDDTHRRLVDFVQSVPEEEFVRETRFRRRLRLDTYSHYPGHAETIRNWRGRTGARRTSGPRRTK